MLPATSRGLLLRRVATGVAPDPDRSSQCAMSK
jgi:hypothetical protein